MGDLAVIGNTAGQGGVILPAIIAGAKKGARTRFLEFFTVNIRNPNTRAAYAGPRASSCAGVKSRGLADSMSPAGACRRLYRAARPGNVAALGQTTSRLHPHAVRLARHRPGGAVNPAHSVRGPRHSVSKGVTPVLSSEEATALLAGMNVSTVVGLRDRAIIAVMTYTFARVGAVVALNVEDYFPQKKRWWLRLHEKNGKVNEMPCHHKLEDISSTPISRPPASTDDRKEPLFRAAIGKTKKLGPGRMSRKDVWCMVRRRAADAGIETRDRLPHLPRHWDNGLPDERRPDRGRAAHGRALERENHGPL